MKINQAPLPTLTQVRQEDDDGPEQRPLDLRLIGRLWKFTRPYAAKRNWLFFLTSIRGLLLNALPWVLASVINGPIQRKDMPGVLRGALLFGLLAVVLQSLFVYRMRLAQQLGESVVHDLRNAIFQHLQRMPMGYFGRTRLGRIISRITSDAEQVRVGVQDVLYMSMVQGVQMLGAAGLMLYFDWRLFLVLLALAPILWAINREFRRRLSKAYRTIQESFSRVTSTLAESVTGIRVTQGFVREDVNAEMFGGLVAAHGEYNMMAVRTTGFFQPLLEFNSQVFFGALLALAGYLILYGHSGAATQQEHAKALVQFFFQAGLFFGPVQGLGQLYNQALMSMAGAERVFQVLDSQPDWVDDPAATDIPPVEGRVEFQDQAEVGLLGGSFQDLTDARQLDGGDQVMVGVVAVAAAAH